MAEKQRLVIVGGGSAAFAAAIRAHDLGAAVTIINDGLPLGGTCVNVGCIPSKTLLRAAEAHYRAGHPGFRGLSARRRVPDFGAVMDQKRELVEELRQGRYLGPASGLPNLEIIKGRARLTGPRTVMVRGRTVSGDRVLLATGASPAVPPIPGLAGSGYLTSRTALELERPPRSMIVLGGRSIALEYAQMFSRFGTRVTILQRSSRILPDQSPDLTDGLTGYLAQEGIEVVTGASINRVRRRGKGVAVEFEVDGRSAIYRAGRLLAATGRGPNTSGLGLPEAGVAMDDRGFILVDETLQTALQGVYAAGDVIGYPHFVYKAAYEGGLAAENALTGGKKQRDYTAMPWVVFTDPQVAGVGLDEKQARERGYDPEAVNLALDQVPRCLAARDTRGFIKLVRDRSTDRLLGARILAPEGGELLMELGLAIRHGLTSRLLAQSFHPYLTLSEAVKLAAQSFYKDPGMLSCCAD